MIGSGPSHGPIVVEPVGAGVRLRVGGPFDLAHLAELRDAIQEARPTLDPVHAVEVDLSALEAIDGAGAVLLARLVDDLEARGARVRWVGGEEIGAGRLIQLYRDRAGPGPAAAAPRPSPMARLGGSVAQAGDTVRGGFNFAGASAAAVPGTLRAPGSVDWRSLPRLIQDIGAGGLPVTAAANFLVGMIIGFLGVAQLGASGR